MLALLSVYNRNWADGAALLSELNVKSRVLQDYTHVYLFKLAEHHFILLSTWDTNFTDSVTKNSTKYAQPNVLTVPVK